ncbi:hypothetical protein Tcan_00824, partial [Toxocara canis]
MQQFNGNFSVHTAVSVPSLEVIKSIGAVSALTSLQRRGLRHLQRERASTEKEVYLLEVLRHVFKQQRVHIQKTTWSFHFNRLLLHLMEHCWLRRATACCQLIIFDFSKIAKQSKPL